MTHPLTISGNENEVGQGIKDSGVPRSEIFITSKLWNTHQVNVKEGLQKTLDNLNVEYLDLYLIHWPVRLVPVSALPSSQSHGNADLSTE
jgi:glycerol 2-dehydrogenase (NADP+)